MGGVRRLYAKTEHLTFFQQLSVALSQNRPFSAADRRPGGSALPMTPIVPARLPSTPPAPPVTPPSRLLLRFSTADNEATEEPCTPRTAKQATHLVCPGAPAPQPLLTLDAAAVASNDVVSASLPSVPSSLGACLPTTADGKAWAASSNSASSNAIMAPAWLTQLLPTLWGGDGTRGPCVCAPSLASTASSDAIYESACLSDGMEADSPSQPAGCSMRGW